MAKDDDDRIPTLEELEARHAQNEQETRDLLAGFDRPGRGPKSGRPSADFVAHYSAGKSGGKRRPGAAPAPKTPDRSREAPTYVLPKEKRGLAWLPWLAAALLMLLLGFLVAFVVTRDPVARPAPVPSAATTITSVVQRRDDVPPPDPAPPVTTGELPEQTIAVPAESTKKPRSRVDESYLRDF